MKIESDEEGSEVILVLSAFYFFISSKHYLSCLINFQWCENIYGYPVIEANLRNEPINNFGDMSSR